MTTISEVLILGLIMLMVGGTFTTVADQTTGQTRRPALPLLQVIDSNALNDSGLTLGFNGAYPASLSENGQCFLTPSSFNGQQLTVWNLEQVKFNMKVAAGTPSGTFQALLFASVGSIPNTCQPAGVALATSNTLTISTIAGDTPFFTFAPPSFQLLAGAVYAVSLRLVSCTLCNGTNYWLMQYSATDFSINDNIYQWTTSYQTFGPHDKLRYEIDGDPVNPTTGNIAGSPGLSPLVLILPLLLPATIIAIGIRRQRNQGTL